MDNRKEKRKKSVFAAMNIQEEDDEAERQSPQPKRKREGS
jgi:hypothetical protein